MLILYLLMTILKWIYGQRSALKTVIEIIL
jgi:hypothetical protein